MEVVIYAMVAYGCTSAGCGYWRSFFWPVECGRLIVRAIEDAT